MFSPGSEPVTSGHKPYSGERGQGVACTPREDMEEGELLLVKVWPRASLGPECHPPLGGLN